MIDAILRATATQDCRVCRSPSYDHTLHVAICEKLAPKIPMWPPAYTDLHSVRMVLAAITSLDDFRPFGGEAQEICSAHANNLRPTEEVHRHCKTLAAIVGNRMPGLCLTCIKENRQQDCYCEHRDELSRERLRGLDPIA